MPGPVSAAELNSANAKAAYLMDYGSKKIMFAQNENKRFPIASMCKIMSLILIYEKIDQGKFKEEDIITVSEQASGMGGSQVFLETNGKYKIGDLIKSIVISSANDSTVAMAEHIAGSEQGFVVLMNKRAKDLGLNDTNFTNCTGLPQPGQYSSARDCAFMLCELINHKNYFNYSRIWMDKMIHSAGRETEMTNTNKLVRFYKGCDGGKTGYTSEAMHCVTVTAQREGMRLISVIIGAESSKVRFGEASKLLNYGFANYQSMPIIKSDTLLEIELEVKGGKQKALTLQAEEDFSYLTKKFDSINYGIDYNLPKNISAPIKKGDVVGKLSVVIDNQVLKEINILAACDIDCKTYADALGDILHCW
ncbi:MAG: D-alanyl-D-alanine carboxypeptidase [Clostridia bacterium]|nr:D-alanyl-D-alanine carboxypeptidase [Clostridia bacterium]